MSFCVREPSADLTCVGVRSTRVGHATSARKLTLTLLMPSSHASCVCVQPPPTRACVPIFSRLMTSIGENQVWVKSLLDVIFSITRIGKMDCSYVVDERIKQALECMV